MPVPAEFFWCSLNNGWRTTCREVTDWLRCENWMDFLSTLMVEMGNHQSDYLYDNLIRKPFSLKRNIYIFLFILFWKKESDDVRIFACFYRFVLESSCVSRSYLTKETDIRKVTKVTGQARFTNKIHCEWKSTVTQNTYMSWRTQDSMSHVLVLGRCVVVTRRNWYL
jgi:hypothetical protein